MTLFGSDVLILGSRAKLLCYNPTVKSDDKSVSISTNGAGIEVIQSRKGKVLALVIRQSLSGQKYNFPTPPDYALQLGINFYKTGEVIKAHRHLDRPRQFTETQEFLMISEGALQVHLYAEEKSPIHSFMLETGDSVLLVSGGHGFDVIRACKITEIKLGPYDEKNDKVLL